MSLKSALLDIKEGLTNQGSKLSVEYVRDIEINNNLCEGSLGWYYNQFVIINRQSKEFKNQHHDDSKKVNRKWSKNEISLMLQYISERQEEWGVNITEVLNEVASLLNRGYQSVNYKYYSLIKPNKVNKELDQSPFKFTTINQKNIPVLSTEVLSPVPNLTESNDMNLSAQNDDLVDVLSELITNIQMLPGINLNDLLRSLYLLTNMAIQNNSRLSVNGKVKLKANQENVLHEKLKKMEQKLMLEKRRNDELQREVLKLAKEIKNYNQLGDIAKIQNLKSYNQSLNQIIDGFELNQKVGS